MQATFLSRATLILVVACIVSLGLVSCGSGGGGGGGGDRNGAIVVPPGNRAPTIVSQIPPIALRVDESRTLNNISSRFSDPDGDELTITAEVFVSSDYITITLSGDQLVIGAEKELPSDVVHTTGTVQVTARDPGGLSVSQTFVVTVSPSARNRAPVISHPFQDLTYTVVPFVPRLEVFFFELSSYFSDPNGDTLTYSWERQSTNDLTAQVSLRGELLHVDSWVREETVGVATITVVARDSGGLTVSQSFTVTILLPGDGPSVVQREIQEATSMTVNEGRDP